jgi:tRNA (guanine-N7-)-methyltransferase
MSRRDAVEQEFGVPIPGEILPPERWVRTALKKLPASGPIDWRAIFGRPAELVLDLGCGNGRFVLGSAVSRPHMDHLGLDRLPLVVRYATWRANQRGLSNVRFAVGGAFEFLDELVAPHTIAEIHVYHPQPYHDARKAYRRLVTPEFLSLVHRSLVPEGRFVIQTDNPAYWRYMLRVAPAFFWFEEQSGPWPDSPRGRTRREIMATRQGLRVFRGWGRPRSDVTESQYAELVERLPEPQFDAARGRRPPGRPRR